VARGRVHRRNWREGAATIAVDNPATGAVIGHVPDLGAAEAGKPWPPPMALLRAGSARAPERARGPAGWAALVKQHADDLR
jgi:succinate-semialdehyde dehydrogenase/glutarate-semialdehyde dehydrogenase